MSEELEKLRHKQYVAERKLTAAKHKEKRLQSELKRLTRSERTHRLCTRAGMVDCRIGGMIGILAGRMVR